MQRLPGQGARPQRPLVDQQMLSDGKDILVEYLGNVLNVSGEGQRVMREALDRYLDRVDRDTQGKTIRLFPFTRLQTAESPHVVAVDPTHRFGKPYLLGCGVETSVVLSRYQGGESIAELADEFATSKDEIEEAIRYESLAA